MSHEDTFPIPISQVPLGYDLLAYCGSHLPEAQRLYADHKQRDDSLLFVRDESGRHSVWKCERPFWPRC